MPLNPETKINAPQSLSGFMALTFKSIRYNTSQIYLCLERKIYWSGSMYTQGKTVTVKPFSLLSEVKGVEWSKQARK